MDIRLLIPYIAPPLVGGFIGYLTNKIAIRMLFRPLKPWLILGVRVPMTPGVIPSKRHNLAVNIGEMVGTHLLTGRDFGEALSREPFQEHLHRLITANINNLLARDCGPLIEIVPQRFRSYFKIGLRTLKYRLRDGVVTFLREEAGTQLITHSLQEQLARLGEREVNELLSETERGGFYDVIDSLTESLLAGPDLEKWLSGYFQEQITCYAGDGKKLGEIIPPNLQELLQTIILDRAPSILQQIGSILAEPKVRDKIIHSIRGGIEEFIASMGPLAAMAAFLDMDMVEGKIRVYLEEKEEAISQWLQNPMVQEKLAEALCRQIENLMDMELKELLAKIDQEQLAAISDQVAEQSLAILRSPGMLTGISSLLRQSLENSIDRGERKVGDALDELLPEDFGPTLQNKFIDQLIAIIHSEQSSRILTKVINSMVDTLLTRPLGVTADLVPAGIKHTFIDYIFISVNKILLNEVPGLLDSLNVRRIVTEKVDSLDLLKLEQLLLSIMEEQFKYINLFGALLGGCIGLLNLLFLRLI